MKLIDKLVLTGLIVLSIFNLIYLLSPISEEHAVIVVRLFFTMMTMSMWLTYIVGTEKDRLQEELKKYKGEQ